ncbi:hypothetical protein EJ05DRAFT_478401 [Pseudovirgaria hyperparasitica]|uniref:EF-hand domain-containing protein n=1 Tax=Pseudovirgaria hyperparasitica TaxID=470096 RepID=A0A6A6VZW4_9PEZI|nr:uncharacterized protein EJ05DRAFT_478401 [Pseudovirgaria hyperparasitica]KAF2755386.1 hypothetical protein EJ05DRAFT_478401 [Pseudovirgaria hyperparasitica]
MKSSAYLTTSSVLLSCFAPSALGHGDHGHAQAPMGEVEGDWATRHMAEEHHINNFDPTTFFKLHDFDSTGRWGPDDIRRIYGLYDETTDSVPESKKSDIVTTIMQMFDHDLSGFITLDEWLEATNELGKVLPDFGTGPGHHGDDEYEYEIHHFEKFHGGDNVKEEDLTHPEDIEHFRKHEEREAMEEAWQKREREGIVVENIPTKFRRF